METVQSQREVTRVVTTQDRPPPNAPTTRFTQAERMAREGSTVLMSSMDTFFSNLDAIDRQYHTTLRHLEEERRHILPRAVARYKSLDPRETQAEKDTFHDTLYRRYQFAQTTDDDTPNPPRRHPHNSTALLHAMLLGGQDTNGNWILHPDVAHTLNMALSDLPDYEVVAGIRKQQHSTFQLGEHPTIQFLDRQQARAVAMVYKLDMQLAGQRADEMKRNRQRIHDDVLFWENLLTAGRTITSVSMSALNVLTAVAGFSSYGGTLAFPMICVVAGTAVTASIINSFEVNTSKGTLHFNSHILGAELVDQFGGVLKSLLTQKMFQMNWLNSVSSVAGYIPGASYIAGTMPGMPTAAHIAGYIPGVSSAMDAYTNLTNMGSDVNSFTRMLSNGIGNIVHPKMVLIQVVMQRVSEGTTFYLRHKWLNLYTRAELAKQHMSRLGQDETAYKKQVFHQRVRQYMGLYGLTRTQAEARVTMDYSVWRASFRKTIGIVAPWFAPLQQYIKKKMDESSDSELMLLSVGGVAASLSVGLVGIYFLSSLLNVSMLWVGPYSILGCLTALRSFIKFIGTKTVGSLMGFNALHAEHTLEKVVHRTLSNFINGLLQKCTLLDGVKEAVGKKGKELVQWGSRHASNAGNTIKDNVLTPMGEWLKEKVMKAGKEMLHPDIQFFVAQCHQILGDAWFKVRPWATWFVQYLGHFFVTFGAALGSSMVSNAFTLPLANITSTFAVNTLYLSEYERKSRAAFAQNRFNAYDKGGVLHGLGTTHTINPDVLATDTSRIAVEQLFDDDPKEGRGGPMSEMELLKLYLKEGGQVPMTEQESEYFKAMVIGAQSEKIFHHRRLQAFLDIGGVFDRNKSDPIVPPKVSPWYEYAFYLPKRLWSGEYKWSSDGGYYEYPRYWLRKTGRWVLGRGGEHTSLMERTYRAYKEARTTDKEAAEIHLRNLTDMGFFHTTMDALEMKRTMSAFYQDMANGDIVSGLSTMLGRVYAQAAIGLDNDWKVLFGDGLPQPTPSSTIKALVERAGNAGSLHEQQGVVLDMYRVYSSTMRSAVREGKKDAYWARAFKAQMEATFKEIMIRDEKMDSDKFVQKMKRWRTAMDLSKYHTLNEARESAKRNITDAFYILFGADIVGPDPVTEEGKQDESSPNTNSNSNNLRGSAQSTPPEPPVPDIGKLRDELRKVYNNMGTNMDPPAWFDQLVLGGFETQITAQITTRIISVASTLRYRLPDNHERTPYLEQFTSDKTALSIPTIQKFKDFLSKVETIKNDIRAIRIETIAKIVHDKMDAFTVDDVKGALGKSTFAWDTPIREDEIVTDEFMHTIYEKILVNALSQWVDAGGKDSVFVNVHSILEKNGKGYKLKTTARDLFYDTPKPFSADRVSSLIASLNYDLTELRNSIESSLENEQNTDEFLKGIGVDEESINTYNNQQPLEALFDIVDAYGKLNGMHTSIMSFQQSKAVWEEFENSLASFGPRVSEILRTANQKGNDNQLHSKYKIMLDFARNQIVSDAQQRYEDMKTRTELLSRLKEYSTDVRISLNPKLPILSFDRKEWDTRSIINMLEKLDKYDTEVIKIIKDHEMRVVYNWIQFPLNAIVFLSSNNQLNAEIRAYFDDNHMPELRNLIVYNRHPEDIIKSLKDYVDRVIKVNFSGLSLNTPTKLSKAIRKRRKLYCLVNECTIDSPAPRNMFQDDYSLQRILIEMWERREDYVNDRDNYEGIHPDATDLLRILRHNDAPSTVPDFDLLNAWTHIKQRAKSKLLEEWRDSIEYMDNELKTLPKWLQSDDLWRGISIKDVLSHFNDMDVRFLEGKSTNELLDLITESLKVDLDIQKYTEDDISNGIYNTYILVITLEKVIEIYNRKIQGYMADQQENLREMRDKMSIKIDGSPTPIFNLQNKQMRWDHDTQSAIDELVERYLQTARNSESGLDIVNLYGSWKNMEATLDKEASQKLNDLFNEGVSLLDAIIGDGSIKKQYSSAFKPSDKEQLTQLAQTKDGGNIDEKLTFVNTIIPHVSALRDVRAYEGFMRNRMNKLWLRGHTFEALGPSGQSKLEKRFTQTTGEWESGDASMGFDPLVWLRPVTFDFWRENGKPAELPKVEQKDEEAVVKVLLPDFKSDYGNTFRANEMLAEIRRQFLHSKLNHHVALSKKNKVEYILAGLKNSQLPLNWQSSIQNQWKKQTPTDLLTQLSGYNEVYNKPPQHANLKKYKNEYLKHLAAGINKFAQKSIDKEITKHDQELYDENKTKVERAIKILQFVKDHWHTKMVTHISPAVTKYARSKVDSGVTSWSGKNILLWEFIETIQDMEQDIPEPKFPAMQDYPTEDFELNDLMKRLEKFQKIDYHENILHAFMEKFFLQNMYHLQASLLATNALATKQFAFEPLSYTDYQRLYSIKFDSTSTMTEDDLKLLDRLHSQLTATSPQADYLKAMSSDIPKRNAGDEYIRNIVRRFLNPEHERLLEKYYASDWFLEKEEAITLLTPLVQLLAFKGLPDEATELYYVYPLIEEVSKHAVDIAQLEDDIAGWKDEKESANNVQDKLRKIYRDLEDGMLANKFSLPTSEDSEKIQTTNDKILNSILPDIKKQLETEDTLINRTNKMKKTALDTIDASEIPEDLRIYMTFLWFGKLTKVGTSMDEESAGTGLQRRRLFTYIYNILHNTNKNVGDLIKSEIISEEFGSLFDNSDEDQTNKQDDTDTKQDTNGINGINGINEWHKFKGHKLGNEPYGLFVEYELGDDELQDARAMVKGVNGKLTRGNLMHMLSKDENINAKFLTDRLTAYVTSLAQQQKLDQTTIQTQMQKLQNHIQQAARYAAENVGGSYEDMPPNVDRILRTVASQYLRDIKKWNKDAFRRINELTVYTTALGKMIYGVGRVGEAVRAVDDAPKETPKTPTEEYKSELLRDAQNLAGDEEALKKLVVQHPELLAASSVAHDFEYRTTIRRGPRVIAITDIGEAKVHTITDPGSGKKFIAIENKFGPEALDPTSTSENRQKLLKLQNEFEAFRQNDKEWKDLPYGFIHPQTMSWINDMRRVVDSIAKMKGYKWLDLGEIAVQAKHTVEHFQNSNKSLYEYVTTTGAQTNDVLLNALLVGDSLLKATKFVGRVRPAVSSGIRGLRTLWDHGRHLPQFMKDMMVGFTSVTDWKNAASNIHRFIPVALTHVSLSAKSQRREAVRSINEKLHKSRDESGNGVVTLQMNDEQRLLLGMGRLAGFEYDFSDMVRYMYMHSYEDLQHVISNGSWDTWARMLAGMPMFTHAYVTSDWKQELGDMYTNAHGLGGAATIAHQLVGGGVDVYRGFTGVSDIYNLLAKYITPYVGAAAGIVGVYCTTTAAVNFVTQEFAGRGFEFSLADQETLKTFLKNAVTLDVSAFDRNAKDTTQITEFKEALKQYMSKPDKFPRDNIPQNTPPIMIQTMREYPSYFVNEFETKTFNEVVHEYASQVNAVFGNEDTKQALKKVSTMKVVDIAQLTEAQKSALFLYIGFTSALS